MSISGISCKRIENWIRFRCRSFVKCECITFTIRRRQFILFFLILRKVQECGCKSSHVHVHDILRINSSMAVLWTRRRLSNSRNSLRSYVNVFFCVNWVAAFVIFFVLVGRDIFFSVDIAMCKMVRQCWWRFYSMVIWISLFFMSTMMEISLFVFSTFTLFFFVITAYFLINFS